MICAPLVFVANDEPGLILIYSGHAGIVNDMSTLYERIGGEKAVNAAVELFYRNLLADGRVARFFDGVDMNDQIAKQKSFLTMAFGGPNNYTGQDMRNAHKRLLEKGLNDSHVDAVLENLDRTLRALGVGEKEVKEVCDLANSVRDDVLSRKQD